MFTPSKWLWSFTYFCWIFYVGKNLRGFFSFGLGNKETNFSLRYIFWRTLIETVYVKEILLVRVGQKMLSNESKRIGNSFEFNHSVNNNWLVEFVTVTQKCSKFPFSENEKKRKNPQSNQCNEWRRVANRREDLKNSKWIWTHTTIQIHMYYTHSMAYFSRQFRFTLVHHRNAQREAKNFFKKLRTLKI